MQYKTGDQSKVISNWISKYHQPRKVTQDKGDLLLERQRETERERHRERETETETARQRHRQRDRDTDRERSDIKQGKRSDVK